MFSERLCGHGSRRRRGNSEGWRDNGVTAPTILTHTALQAFLLACLPPEGDLQ